MIHDNEDIRERPEAPQPTDPDQSAQDDVQAELDDLTDRLKRVTADYQNYQKRVAREMAEVRRFANEQFAREILAVVDDLERALAATANTQSMETIVEGVRISHEDLMALLARHGVTAIQAEGLPFDPQVHEAMMQQPTDQAEPMTVLKELRKGYRMHDRTLRPARVIVAAAPEQPEKKD